MKRMHVGIKVDDVDATVSFYTRVFGAEPTLRRPDYAKWMLDDPRVNFSVDRNGSGAPGSAHYGIEAESPGELAELRERFDSAGLRRSDQNDLVCGYQHQDKSWVTDPSGNRWEAFYTSGVVEGGGYGTAAMPEESEES